MAGYGGPPGVEATRLLSPLAPLDLTTVVLPEGGATKNNITPPTVVRRCAAMLGAEIIVHQAPDALADAEASMIAEGRLPPGTWAWQRVYTSDRGGIEQAAAAAKAMNTSQPYPLEAREATARNMRLDRCAQCHVLWNDGDTMIPMECPAQHDICPPCATNLREPRCPNCQADLPEGCLDRSRVFQGIEAPAFGRAPVILGIGLLVFAYGYGG